MPNTISEEFNSQSSRRILYTSNTPSSKENTLGTKTIQGSFVLSKDITITDADTFVLPGGKSLRLYGADAPETSIHDKTVSKGFTRGTNQYDKEYKRQDQLARLDRQTGRYKYITQFKGNEATSRVRQLLNEGKGFFFKEESKDTYGRTLVSAYTADGKSISNTLIKEGLATTELPGDRFFKGTPQDFDNVDAMVQAYQERKGLWSDPRSVAPSTFRKRGPNRQGIFTINKLPTLKQSIEQYIKRESYKEQGLLNNQYAQILADEDQYFTLPASLGASAHYGRSLNNSLMQQARMLSRAVLYQNYIRRLSATSRY